MPSGLELLTEILPSPGMTDSVTTLYLATGCTPVPHDRHGPEEEHMELLHVPLDEADGDGRARRDRRRQDGRRAAADRTPPARVRPPVGVSEPGGRRSARCCHSRSRSSCRGWSPRRGDPPNTIAAYRRDLAAYCDWLGAPTAHACSTSIHQQLVDVRRGATRERCRHVVDRPAAGGRADAAPLPVDRGRAT